MADPNAQSSIPGADNFDPDFDQWKASRGENTTAAGDVFAASPNAGLLVLNGGMFDTEKKGQKDPRLTVKDVMWRFYRWSDQQVRALAARLAKAGFQVSENSSRDVVWNSLYDVLMEAATRVQALGEDRAPTVDQILQGYMKNPVGDIAAEDKKPETYTQTAESLTDPSNAHALLDGVLAKALGRDPTAAEKAGFLAALNSAERANPQKTKYTLNPETGQYDTSSTSGGMNAEQFAQEWVDDDPTRKKESGDMQMATTYFDAMLQAIQSPVS